MPRRSQKRGEGCKEYQHSENEHVLQMVVDG